MHGTLQVCALKLCEEQLVASLAAAHTRAGAAMVANAQLWQALAEAEGKLSQGPSQFGACEGAQVRRRLQAFQ